MKVLVLGASGMLGSMVTEVLSEKSDLQVVGTSRKYEYQERMTSKAGWMHFDAGYSSLDIFEGIDWVVNCIGAIKPRIESVRQAIEINSLFPHKLANFAKAAETHVIQIATDCVYSGYFGGYSETSEQDALDVYGKTKSLGEVISPNVHHLRCSIIGPELGTQYSLLEWFLNQPEYAVITGYVNHFWNGITTLAFANLCYAIIEGKIAPPVVPVQHVIPFDITTKDILLRIFSDEYGRGDLQIQSTVARESVNRTLLTDDMKYNNALWKVAGYDGPPSIREMIHQMKEYTGYDIHI